MRILLLFLTFLPAWAAGLPHLDLDLRLDPGQGLLAADAGFAEAALRLKHSSQRYRLARKKTLEAVAQLSGAIRRLADEPNTNRRALASLGELLGANYLLASDLSSMPVLVKLRAQDLDAPAAKAAIAATRERVTALLSPEGGAEGVDAAVPLRDSLAGMHGSAAMEVLGRRLDHLEHAARKVARLAARPVIDGI